MDEVCACGHVKDEHGGDRQYPGSSACQICSCVAFDGGERACAQAWRLRPLALILLTLLFLVGCRAETNTIDQVVGMTALAAIAVLTLATALNKILWRDR